MEQLFIVGVYVAILYYAITYIDTIYVKGEEMDNRTVIRGTVVTYISTVCGLYVASHLGGVVMESGSKSKGAFIGLPDF